MHLGEICPDGSMKSFVNGTTNGAEWYPLAGMLDLFKFKDSIQSLSSTGGMQDYNYIFGSCMEITLELSCCKYPPRRTLPDFWNQNRKALISYLNEVHRGVRGIITNTNGVAVPAATLRIKGRNVSFRGSNRGEYWRILLPGSYVLQVNADGYHPSETSFEVRDGQVSYVNVELRPLSQVMSPSLLDSLSLPRLRAKHGTFSVKASEVMHDQALLPPKPALLQSNQTTSMSDSSLLVAYSNTSSSTLVGSTLLFALTKLLLFSTLLC